MKTFTLTYIPRGNLAPRPADIRTREIEAAHAGEAARKAAGIERRSGDRVLTVREKTQ